MRPDCKRQGFGLRGTAWPILPAQQPVTGNNAENDHGIVAGPYQVASAS